MHGVNYALEYGTDRLEIHADALRGADALNKGHRVLMVDDLLATGGTMGACCELVRMCGAEIAGITVLMELAALKGREGLRRFGEVHAVLEY